MVEVADEVVSVEVSEKLVVVGAGVMGAEVSALGDLVISSL